MSLGISQNVPAIQKNTRSAKVIGGVVSIVGQSTHEEEDNVGLPSLKDVVPGDLINSWNVVCRSESKVMAGVKGSIAIVRSWIVALLVRVVLEAVSKACPYV